MDTQTNPQIEISLQNASDSDEVPEEGNLRRWALNALAPFSDSAEICLRIVNMDESAKLNQEYRDKSGPTNVLSFPYPREAFETVEIQGDLVLCAEVVKKEAVEQSKSLEAHWAHMVTHGILHLLGYDHIQDKDADEMEQLEIQLLDKLGYPNPYQQRDP